MKPSTGDQMTELKPCPCGGTADARYDPDCNCRISCFGCGLSLPSSETFEEAVANWNHHPMHELERLREIVKDSAGLHNIVKQQNTQLRVLNLKIQTACKMLRDIVRLGGKPEHYHQVIELLENNKDVYNDL